MWHFDERTDWLWHESKHDQLDSPDYIFGLGRTSTHNYKPNTFNTLAWTATTSTNEKGDKVKRP